MIWGDFLVRSLAVRFFSVSLLFLLFCFPSFGAAFPDGDFGGSDGFEFDSSLPSSVVVSSFPFEDFFSSLSQFSFVEEEGQGELIDLVAIPVPMADDGIAPVYDLDDGQTVEPAGTLKAILVKLIGPYNPVVVQYRYQNTGSSTYSYVREIQPDYVWWGAAALFCLLIWCTFRLGGVFLRKI